MLRVVLGSDDFHLRLLWQVFLEPFWMKGNESFLNFETRLIGQSPPVRGCWEGWGLAQRRQSEDKLRERDTMETHLLLNFENA